MIEPPYNIRPLIICRSRMWGQPCCSKLNSSQLWRAGRSLQLAYRAVVLFADHVEEGVFNPHAMEMLLPHFPIGRRGPAPATSSLPAFPPTQRVVEPHVPWLNISKKHIVRPNEGKRGVQG